jgi:hypothetical protein
MKPAHRCTDSTAGSSHINCKFTIPLFLLCLCSCASLPAPFLPTITNERLEAFIAEEAQQILRVSGNAHKATLYKFYLARFPREDILGLSFGEQRIFISYQLTRLAREKTGYLWLFRQTLAHEIAHDELEHAKNQEVASLNAVRQSHARITGETSVCLCSFRFAIIRRRPNWLLIKQLWSTGRRSAGTAVFGSNSSEAFLIRVT